MKSIMQEASSVIKAIEQAWQRAEQPQEFSVKIFEEPEKNFFGITTKSAKIALFFGNAPKKKNNNQSPSKSSHQKPKSNHGAKKEVSQSSEKVTPGKKTTPQIKQQQNKPIQTVAEAKPEQKKEKRLLWNDDMITIAKNWLNQSLKAMGKANESYTVETNEYYLRITFQNSLAETEKQEREIFRSFSFLVLQALKRQLKRPLRGFKVVITKQEQ